MTHLVEVKDLISPLPSVREAVRNAQGTVSSVGPIGGGSNKPTIKQSVIFHEKNITMERATMVSLSL